MWEMNRRAQAVLLLLAAALLFAGGYRYANWVAARAAAEVAVIEPEKQEDEQPAKRLAVHVAGAVSRPGVYFFDEGCRVNDAVREAQPLPDADVDSLNLARRLVDGERIYVPKVGEAPETAAGAALSGMAAGSGGALSGAGIAGGKININTASAAELESLPGIGPTLAQRIVDYRSTHGPFKAPEDLMNVSGIGTGRYEQIKDLITI
ncbi:MAG: competence protein ComEA [Thermacetogenium sp.]|uniref:Competence protein ComEA n=1 Tax=Thermacetogenium phaeum TaxID=85874 RepID=A0A101FHL2_9THEO|nr:MAG: Competence protein ComEA [Thermacetogenium phaeum]MDN5376020.1 competence protein ComEA [Thermacetogenium sp.]